MDESPPRRGPPRRMVLAAPCILHAPLRALCFPREQRICAVMSSGTETGALYLIDAHALIFQVFHAIRGMTNPSGLPTNALFGFARDLLFLRSLRPDYLVCAFDRAEP